MSRAEVEQAVQVIENVLHDLYLEGVDCRRVADLLGFEFGSVQRAIEHASDRDPGRLAGGKRRSGQIRRVRRRAVVEGNDPQADLSRSITPDESFHNPDNRTCLTCSRSFVGGQSNSENCSSSCAKLAWRKRCGEDITEQVMMLTNPPPCQGCGKPLTGKRVGTKWCSDACRKGKERAADHE